MVVYKREIGRLVRLSVSDLKERMMVGWIRAMIVEVESVGGLRVCF